MKGKNKKEQIMKRMIGIIVLTMIMLFISISILGANVTVEEFKNKLSEIEWNTYDTFEGNIEIEMDGNVIGESKIYIKGNMKRIEIAGKPEFGIESIIMITDTNGIHTKTGTGEWQTGAEGIYSNNQMDQIDSKGMIEEMINKDGFKIEECNQNNAIIKYKENMGMGAGEVRVGIDMKKGEMRFQEIEMNEGNSKIIFEYGEIKGKRYLKEMKINTQISENNSTMIMTYKNVKIDKKISDDKFQVK